MYILWAILLLGFLVNGHTSSALNKVWEEWKIKHGKVYDNQVGVNNVTLILYLQYVLVRLWRWCFCFRQRLLSGEQCGRRTCS